MSWGFWSDFLNSNDDYYPLCDNEDMELAKEADKWKNLHKEEAALIEKIMDNPELIKEYDEREEI